MAKTVSQARAGKPKVVRTVPKKILVPAAKRPARQILRKAAALKAPRVRKPVKRITGADTVKVRDLHNGAEYELPKKIRPSRPYKLKQEIREEEDRVIITKSTSTTETFGKTTTYTRIKTEIAEIEEDLFRKLYDLDERDLIRDGIDYNLDEEAFPPYFDRL